MSTTVAGSRMHVLDLVEGRGGDFIQTLNQILRPVRACVSASDYWMPKGRTEPAEALLSTDCEPLVPGEISRTLRQWWLAVDHPLANEPNWDLAATARFRSDGCGLVLAEAKAHVEELANEAKGKSRSGNPENHRQIGLAIRQAGVALGGDKAGVLISRDTHYQFSNRIALGWKLAKEGIPTVLIYLGFTGDNGIRDLGEILRDDAHWRETVLNHTRDVFPSSFFERELDCGGTPFWILIRSLPCARQSPDPAMRRKLA